MIVAINGGGPEFKLYKAWNKKKYGIGRIKGVAEAGGMLWRI